eukprot:13796520-Alexandrium_andersonii.AAC.1
MSMRASTHLPRRSRRPRAGMTTSVRASLPAAASALRQAPAMPARPRRRRARLARQEMVTLPVHLAVARALG